MAHIQNNAQPSDWMIAISNTGPLVSAFQSDSFHILSELFDEIRISSVCKSELIKHGWEGEIQKADSKLIILHLTANEEREAKEVAKRIAQHPRTNDPVIESHLGEAQVIVVALRDEHKEDFLLLDELAARDVARQMGANLSGFPGVLILAVQEGLITAEDVKKRLEICQAKGTHYSNAFIKHVYQKAKQG
ncbi:MAG: hypothetical protein AAF639_13665 [Chloroflexota bacterium]